MTTPLFLLRSVELGISIRDLDLLRNIRGSPLRRISISSERKKGTALWLFLSAH